MTGRSVPEWIGSGPDAKVPAAVKARIFTKWLGRCHITGWKIGPADLWEVEHIKPLSMGGEHREKNLAPALVEPHRRKTAEEAGVRAKADRMKAKHLGIKTAKPGGFRGWRKMDGTVVWRADR